jgi:flagellar FliJ protein
MEETLQKDLAVFKKLLAGERKRLWDFKKSRNKLLGELHEKQKKHITISEIILYLSFIEQLSKNLEKQEERVLDAEKKVDTKREDLIEAMKKRKTVEKLKEKGLKAYRQDLLKKEMNFLNEVAINGFSPRS